MRRWRALWRSALWREPHFHQGLHDVRKALVAAYLTHELRRPHSLSPAPIAARISRGNAALLQRIFPGATGGVATLPPSTGSLGSQSPHADIPERRAATLFLLRMDRFLW